MVVDYSANFYLQLRNSRFPSGRGILALGHTDYSTVHRTPLSTVCHLITHQSRSSSRCHIFWHHGPGAAAPGLPYFLLCRVSPTWPHALYCITACKYPAGSYRYCSVFTPDPNQGHARLAGDGYTILSKSCVSSRAHLLPLTVRWNPASIAWHRYGAAPLGGATTYRCPTRVASNLTFAFRLRFPRPVRRAEHCSSSSHA